MPVGDNNFIGTSLKTLVAVEPVKLSYKELLVRNLIKTRRLSYGRAIMEAKKQIKKSRLTCGAFQE